MPNEWRAEIAEVHLLADLPPKMWASSPRVSWVGLATAVLHRHTKTRRDAVTPGVLRIRCRGATREDSARATLYAVAAACGHLGPTKRTVLGLTKPQRRILDEVVQPVLDGFLQLARAEDEIPASAES